MKVNIAIDDFHQGGLPQPDSPNHDNAARNFKLDAIYHHLYVQSYSWL
jgi:hypothetical protein